MRKEEFDMKIPGIVRISIMWLILATPLFGQGSQNCFLEESTPKYAVVPPYEDLDKTTAAPEVTITVNSTDTLGKVSNFIFGNAAAVWVSQSINNPVLVGHLQKLSPTFIRFPGGSWSDIYFWSGNPGGLPSGVPDPLQNGQMVTFYPQFGPNYPLTVDAYYDLRNQLGAEGLITINYAYARYGLGAKPAEQAAHYAADWVRYDGGRTMFWEIGNENAGPWESGWLINHATNQDGQPDTISGELYGKHFKIFADSMRAAAAELSTTIYIGGQILHYDGTTSWNAPDRTWNEGFFREVGDAADFYVMHNYFGNSSTTVKSQVDAARSAIISNISFIRQDIANKQASSKPVAITEWNCGGPDLAKTSIANGMQAVVLLCEMINNNFGMSARWLIANWDADGMFYFLGNNASSYPKWNPRPDFYYLYYLQQFVGDHVVSTSVAGSTDILAYASTFTSKHGAAVVVNKGTADKVVKLDPVGLGVGDRFYVYTLTGIDASQWPQAVVVNNYSPTSVPWGPLDSLLSIPADAFPIENEIRFLSPAQSVQFVLIDNGQRIISEIDGKTAQIVEHFQLEQNYPNPFNPSTEIGYAVQSTGDVTLKVYDILGREVAVLLNERKPAGKYSLQFDASGLASGVYFYRLAAGTFVQTRKMVVLK